jgi:hypothetical protein
MDQKQFDGLVQETIAGIQQLLVVKGGEYAGSADRLANFKRGASLTGVTPLQCAFIYASKHYDAIATFVRDDAAGESRPRSESIEGRLDDLINYCLLMKGIIRETTPVLLSDTAAGAINGFPTDPHCEMRGGECDCRSGCRKEVSK